MKLFRLLLLAAIAATLRAAPAPCTSAELLSQVARALSAHFRVDGNLQLQLLQTWTAPARPANRWTVNVLEYPGVVAPTMLVRVRLLGDGAAVDETSLLLGASLWRDAWFSRDPETAGTPFDAGGLTTQSVDFLRQRDALPADEREPGMMFCRDVPPDRMLTWHDIARRPLVHKGEIVEVVASEGMLYVTMKALALESGARGDLVTVRNLESLKNISGEVVGDDRVRVQF